MRTIRVVLVRAGETMLNMEADYEYWSTVSHVVVGEEIYAYKPAVFNSKQIHFVCHPEGKVIRVSDLADIMHCGNVAASRDNADSKEEN